MIVLLAICCLSMFLVPVHAWATCSGSGLTWSCTAGSTVAQVNTAIGSATDGATITFAPGKYSWSGTINLPNTKGINLIGAGPGSSVVSTSGTVIGMLGSFSGTNTKNYRISGFTFQIGARPIWFYGTGILANIRIDHNAFSNLPACLWLFFSESNPLMVGFGE